MLIYTEIYKIIQSLNIRKICNIEEKKLHNPSPHLKNCFHFMF